MLKVRGGKDTLKRVLKEKLGLLIILLVFGIDLVKWGVEMRQLHVSYHEINGVFFFVYVFIVILIFIFIFFLLFYF